MTDTEYRIIKAINHIREAIWDLTDGTGFSRNGRMNMKGLEETLEPLREAFEAHPLSPPSSDNKTLPSPDRAPNSGTPEPIDTDRWNWTVVDGALWVCRRDHEKYEACEYSPATPEEIASAGKGEPPLMP